MSLDLSERSRSSIEEALADELPEKALNAPPPYADDIMVHLSIIHGSIWGLLVRKALINLTTYNGSYVGGVAWANFCSCFIMGMLAASERIWSRVSKKHPNHLLIGTGFCGTCSSFSSLILDAFGRSTDTVEGVFYNYPNAAYGIMEFFSVVLTQLALSVFAFQMGIHAMGLEPRIPEIPYKVHQRFAYWSSAMGVILVIITAVLLGTQNYGTWRNWMFSCLFAPFGALTRFYLSKLNPKYKRFPIGTFLANFIGTLLLSVFTLITRAKNSHGAVKITSIIGCQVLHGLLDGYCGGLTTISTFTAELFTLKITDKYVYSVVSIAATYVPMMLIVGVYNWTDGLGKSVCL